MTDYIDPMLDPEKSNALMAKVLHTTEAAVKPEIALPAAGVFRLPGGLVRGLERASEARYDAEVRELTGADEEAIAKARVSGRIDRFITALLECGTVSIGNLKANREVLGDLLVGDRDALLLEIRRATFGDEIEYERVTCPHCGQAFALTLTLDDIPVVRLKDTEDRTFEVPLRKGRVATVRFPVGSDQDAIFAAESLNGAEQATLLLSRCVISIKDTDGEIEAVAGDPSVVRDLGIPDRKRIMDTISKNAPGPRYDEITFTHEECGKEVPFAIGVGDLFQDL